MAQVAVKAQGQQEFKCPGLAGSVRALEDHPAAAEVKGALAELPDVDDSASVQSPPMR
jgi:hypothetical protein